ncbi:MAG: DISARM system helicase DrmA, partial [Elainellaceae cyanobacterium]
MKVIKLPSVLPGDVDLKAINQQLKERIVQLDWSAVVSAPAAALAVLLEGLDQSDDAEVLGVEGAIADTVIQDIITYFEQRPALPKPQIFSQKKPQAQQPEVWHQAEVAPNPLEVTDSMEEGVFYPTDDEADEPPAPKANWDDSRVLKTATSFEIRQQLEERILKDLLGPAGGEYEEIDEGRVSDRYLVGLVAPLHRRKRQDATTTTTDSAQDLTDRPGTVDEGPEQRDGLPIAGNDTAEDGSTEAGNAVAESMFPSSLGLTFCVSGEAKTIQVIAGWGQYERERSQTLTTDAGNAKTVWRRIPIRSQSQPIPLQPGPVEDWQIHPDYGVFVRGQIRRQDNDWIVSLFLVNGQTEYDTNPDQSWLFQPELKVKSGDASDPEVFIKRAPIRHTDHKLDPLFYAEEQDMKMLYRKQVEFAVGHGVGVHATVAAQTPMRAIALETRVVPAYEVHRTTPPNQEEIPALAELELEMKALAETPATDLPQKLAALPTAYAQWIADQTELIEDPAESLTEHREAAERALERCETALNRIREGLETLRQNPQAAQAFQFMNQAMYLQRRQSLYAAKVRQGEATDSEPIESPTWFPFQLAFILLNLPSSTDLHHRDRSHETDAIADLLWFPTGGGKTEAYLGLAAYTMGLRRLQGTVAGRSGAAGVAVLMRYTLRLLTLQQFQRATALICACEVIRREDPVTWGKEPFRIGLWVGMKTTPNRTDDSEAVIDALRGNRPPPSSGSPYQLTACPWCGSAIDKGKHLSVSSFKKGTGRTLVHCGDALGRCPFSKKQAKDEGLPIVVVDEEIYRRLPTLLIATVDKFAQMPWKGETQMLFGQVDGYCDRHGYRSPEVDDSDSHPARYGLPKAKTQPVNPLRPPDLIIQDELHLISGPLGTLVGLYETAIDRLASWEVDGQRVRPKVIASTATIRQAQDQVHSLFVRKVEVFPPQGLEVGDNFFSRQRAPSEEHPGRLYLGICATGRRLKAATIRTYTAILAAAQSLFEEYGDRVDPWMTLVGYFNSMRELGGTRRLVDDDIQQRLRKMDRRGLARRQLRNIEELTSRKSSTDIPLVLDQLETSFENQPEAAKESKGKRRRPLDVLLATNMISVGVDVSRLAVMAVTGQPKTTAEYIQSTSRVGRRHPGLVITIFNWARPRDLSHYERFEQYHATFYQHVESLSLTPFSSG